AAREVERVLSEADAERASQVPRTTAQLFVRDVSASRRSTLAHQARALQRCERANQHGRGLSLSLGHRVDKMVNPVIEVDVGQAGGTGEGWITGGVAAAPR